MFLALNTPRVSQQQSVMGCHNAIVCAAASIANAFTKNSLKHLLKVKDHRAVFVAKLGEVVP